MNCSPPSPWPPGRLVLTEQHGSIPSFLESISIHACSLLFCCYNLWIYVPYVTERWETKMRKVSTSQNNISWHFLQLLEGNVIPPGLTKVRKLWWCSRTAASYLEMCGIQQCDVFPLLEGRKKNQQGNRENKEAEKKWFGRTKSRFKIPSCTLTQQDKSVLELRSAQSHRSHWIRSASVSYKQTSYQRLPQLNFFFLFPKCYSVSYI